MFNPLTRKSCVVPKCTNTTIKTPEKLFFQVPRDPNVRKKWLNAAKRADPVAAKSCVYCCENHFDVENDMENYIKYKLVGGKLKLRKDVVPHKFECQKKIIEVKEGLSVRKRLKKGKIVRKRLRVDIDDLPATSNNAIDEIFDDLPATSNNAIDEIFVDKSSPHKTVNEDPLESLETNYEVSPEPQLVKKCSVKLQVMEETKKPSYKYCMVPQCKNTVRNSPDKVFFRIPSDAKVRNEWCKIMGKDNVSRILCLYCCEDHFNIKEDTDNYSEYNTMKQQGKKCNLRLKKGVVPHIFLGRKRNMSPPVEESGLVKRQRIAPTMEEAEKPSYKYCVVPECENTIRSAPDKEFFRLPFDVKSRKQWFKMMRTQYVSPKTCLYCCEDHFNVKEDTANYFEYKTMKHQGDRTLRLKKGVVPHIFGQKRNTSPPVEDDLVKRKRLVNEALSEFATKSSNEPPQRSDDEKDEPVDPLGPPDNDPLRQPDDGSSRQADAVSMRQFDDDSNNASSSTDNCYTIKFEPEEMEEDDESPDSFSVCGLVPPVFTPMNEDGSINFPLIPSYAKYLADSGIKAVLVGGTTGENMSLRVGDRMKLVDWWLEAAKDTGLHIMVQVGGAPLADVLTLAQYCQKAGAHSLLTLPELYFKPQTVEELVSYVQLVAAAAPRLPVLYYHIPSMSKVEINMPKFVTAATERIPNFKGIKFTSNDLSEAAQVLRSLEKGQEIFLGADTLIAPAALLGIKSSIGTSFNLLPALAQLILQAVEGNQVARARHLQEKLSLAIEAHTCEGPWVPIMKAGMELLTGIKVGPPSLPQQPISDEAKARIAARLSELGVAEYVRSYDNPSQI